MGYVLSVTLVIACHTVSFATVLVSFFPTSTKGGRSDDTKTAVRETIDTGNNFNSITRTLVVWVASESQEVMVLGRMILGTPFLLIVQLLF